MTGLAVGFLDDLPDEDQTAVSKVVGKRIKFNGYDANGRAELESKDASGRFHTIYVKRSFVKAVRIQR